MSNMIGSLRPAFSAAILLWAWILRGEFRQSRTQEKGFNDKEKDSLKGDFYSRIGVFEWISVGSEDLHLAVTWRFTTATQLNQIERHLNVFQTLKRSK